MLIDVDENVKFSLLNLVGVQHIIADATGIQTHAEMRRSIEPRFRSQMT